MKKILFPIFLLLTVILVACGEITTPASSLVVTPESITVNVGKSIEIDVVVLPADTNDKTLEWIIEDPSVATITDEGELTGLKVGETILTIRVKATPAVTQDVEVSVVEEYWPNDEIEEHYGFTLPKFPNYSSLTLKPITNNVLEFVVAGYGNDVEALDAYHLLLVVEGWVAGTNNDSHIGTYTKEGVSAILSYHNNTSHGTNNIEFKIAPKSQSDETNWPNDILEKEFGWTLPDFVDYITLEVNVAESGLVTITLNDTEHLEESLAIFTTNMQAAGWVAGENNGLDGGDFSKDDANASIMYTNFATLMISIFPKVHINQTWEQLTTKITTKFELNLPDFSGASNVSYRETPSQIIGNLMLEDSHEELEAYLLLLEVDGWVAREGFNHHLGTYTKGEFEFYYHESHSVVGQVDFKLTKVEHHHHNHYHWDDLQAEVLAKFEIELPDFAGSHEVEFTVSENQISGFVELSDRHSQLEAFLTLLEADGWLLKEGSNHHLGTYTKGEFEFFYHEDHHEETKIEFKVSVIQ